MTEREKIIASAYTGYMFVDDFSLVHKYIEQKMGRPMWTHEFADKKTKEEIHEAVKLDFLEMTRSADDE